MGVPQKRDREMACRRGRAGRHEEGSTAASAGKRRAHPAVARQGGRSQRHLPTPRRAAQPPSPCPGNTTLPSAAPGHTREAVASAAAHPVPRVLQPVVEPLLLNVAGHPARLLVVGQQLQREGAAGRERAVRCGTMDGPRGGSLAGCADGAGAARPGACAAKPARRPAASYYKRPAAACRCQVSARSAPGRRQAGAAYARPTCGLISSTRTNQEGTAL